MTLALIISPYNAPTAAERAANVRLGIALARWAAAQGYTPVGWWDMINIDDPPDDADPNVRQPALKRDAERARMVGAAGGVAVMPGWIAMTAGMRADYSAWRCAGDARLIDVDYASLAPYLLPEPVPAVPRASVQAAVDLMDRQFEKQIGTESREWNLGRIDGIACGMRSVFRHTGVTPTEVTP